MKWICILTLNLLKKWSGWLSLCYVVAHVLVLSYGRGLNKKLKNGSGLEMMKRMDKILMNQLIRKIAYQYQCDINFSDKCLI